MKSNKPKVLLNAHVYLVGSEFWIPTVVKKPSGVWTETRPVEIVDTTDLQALAAVLARAKETSGAIRPEQVIWDGDAGRVWESAERRWSIYWYDNGAVAIVPKVLIPLELDRITGDVLDGGWADDKEHTQILSDDTPMSQIAAALGEPTDRRTIQQTQDEQALKVVSFNQVHLGTISQSSTGQLRLEVLDEHFRTDMETFVRRLLEEPVYLTLGERRQKGGKTIFVTKRQHIHPGQPQFLAAARELLNTIRFGEMRVRGLIVTTGGPHGG